MQKKVKAGAYKNKKQFAHDLDLIWDNCLVYNSDPVGCHIGRSFASNELDTNTLATFYSPTRSDVMSTLCARRQTTFSTTSTTRMTSGTHFGNGKSCSVHGRPQVERVSRSAA